MARPIFLLFAAVASAQQQCSLPTSNPCVNRVSPGDFQAGVAAIFDPACPADPSVASMPFCDFVGIAQCRACVYDDELYLAMHQGSQPSDLKGMPQCPCCVAGALQVDMKDCGKDNSSSIPIMHSPSTIESSTACDLPKNAPCVDLASSGDVAAGLGVVYDQGCPSQPTHNISMAGCNVQDQRQCRFCIRDAGAYRERFHANLPPYPFCPCCVVGAYGLDPSDYPACEVKNRDAEHKHSNYSDTQGGSIAPTPSPTSSSDHGSGGSGHGGSSGGGKMTNGHTEGDQSAASATATFSGGVLLLAALVAFGV